MKCILLKFTLQTNKWICIQKQRLPNNIEIRNTSHIMKFARVLKI